LNDLNFAIQHPNSVLDLLSLALGKDKTDQQSLAVLQEFVKLAEDEFRQHPSSELAGNLVEEVERFLNLHPSARTNAVSAILRELEIVADELEIFPDIKEMPEREAQAASTEKEAVTPAPLEELDIQQARIAELEGQLKKKDHEMARLSRELDELISQLTQANWRITELEESLSDQGTYTDEPIDRPPLVPGTIDGSVLPPRTHILVIGDSRVQEQKLAGICKQLRIDKDQVQFELDYNAFDNISLDSLQYNGSIAGILIGPVPHKVRGCDDPANTLISSIGFPPTVKIETSSGELKITKSSFREALNRLLVKIATL
jgi:hypothetical protein